MPWEGENIRGGSDEIVFCCSELYLDGNNLECEGLIELIKLIVDKAEQEMIERKENQSSQDSLAAGFPLLDVKTTLSRVQEAGASQSNPVVQ